MYVLKSQLASRTMPVTGNSHDLCHVIDAIGNPVGLQDKLANRRIGKLRNHSPGEGERPQDFYSLNQHQPESLGDIGTLRRNVENDIP